jgi:hypothetical protein
MAQEQPDGHGRVVSLVDGVVFGRQFSEEGAKSGWGGWRVCEFLAEVEVEPDPLVVVGPLGLGNAGSVEPTLETR